MVTVSGALEYTLGVKRAFVEKYLKPMLKETAGGVKSVAYDAVMTVGGAYAESETVTIEFHGGGVLMIDVSGDSCLQIVKDVLKKI